ncbi:hypothetical protein HQQ94_17730 [Shewanella sp. VB17]|uniref:hypothetical protein n=1 Tax=Shewanella sp. VB17 TaxID=2739432 RepID=UPI001565BBF8|nr:hypothetical protein [Shewanella sp. VB17]NRD75022.1 hypothetical protein [Shewanella sp. VB17]
MSYYCAHLVRRFIILSVWIIVSMLIGWANLAFAQTDKINTFLVHFPPFQYEPALARPGRPGLSVELWDLANPEDAPNQNRTFYPPSRLFKMAVQGKLEVFSTAQFMINKYGLLKHYRCTGNTVESIIVLYQNLDIAPREMIDLNTELTGENILVPEESKLFFQSLIKKSNEVFAINQPINMVNMFISQRAAYMLDFQARAETGLAQHQKPPFTIKRYVLLRLKNSICVTKQHPDLFADVMQQYWNFRKMKDTPEAHRLEDKYNFKLNWGPDEGELTPE